MKKYRLVEELVGMDKFENAIRGMGVVASCEWFGHKPDSDFTESTISLFDKIESGFDPRDGKFIKFNDCNES